MLLVVLAVVVVGFFFVVVPLVQGYQEQRLRKAGLDAARRAEKQKAP